MSNNTTSPSRHRTAYHGAAHAVAEYRHGKSPQRLSLRLNGSPHPCHQPLAGAISPERVSEWVTISLTGMAAEMELAGESLMTVVTRSPEVLTNVDDVLHLHRLGSVKEWLQRAREFVAVESRAIGAVADQLVERGVLDGLEVELIIDSVDEVPGATDSLSMIRASGWDAASQESAA